MFEAYVTKELGLLRNFAFFCVSVTNLHGTVRRAVLNNKYVYFERKVLLNEN